MVRLRPRVEVTSINYVFSSRDTPFVSPDWGLHCFSGGVFSRDASYVSLGWVFRCPGMLLFGNRPLMSPGWRFRCYLYRETFFLGDDVLCSPLGMICVNRSSIVVVVGVGVGGALYEVFTAVVAEYLLQ